MLKRTLSTKFSLSQLYQERDAVFHRALLALSRAYRDGRLSANKYWDLDERLHSQFERKQRPVEIIAFVDEWTKQAEEFDAI